MTTPRSASKETYILSQILYNCNLKITFTNSNPCLSKKWIKIKPNFLNKKHTQIKERDTIWFLPDSSSRKYEEKEEKKKSDFDGKFKMDRIE